MLSVNKVFFGVCVSFFVCVSVGRERVFVCRSVEDSDAPRRETVLRGGPSLVGSPCIRPAYRFRAPLLKVPLSGDLIDPSGLCSIPRNP